MPIAYRPRSKPDPARVGSSRALTISTGAATLVVSSIGYMGWSLTCLGPGSLTWGDSSMSMGSGALLYYSMAKEWYPIADTMSTFLRADSVATVVLINEYL